jgi:hypothetical protein
VSKGTTRLLEGGVSTKTIFGSHAVKEHGGYYKIDHKQPKHI